MSKTSKKFVPVRETPDYSYTAELVLSYIREAYGETDKNKSNVPMGLSCGQEALEKMGYEYEEGDGYFPKDPRIPEPVFTLGSLVVTENGGVGRVTENENDDYSIEWVPGWKEAPNVAWYNVDELRQLKE